MGLEADLINLNSLQSHLPKYMRESFLNIRQHGPLIGHLNTLNACFVPLLEYLVLYKSEVGLSLQRMVEAYNILILMQFESYVTTENVRTKEAESKLIELEGITKDVN